MKRRLVLLPNWMGDAVMAEPSLRALGNAAASCDVEMIGVGRAASVAALAGHDAFSELKVIADRGLLGPWRAGRELRKLGAEEALLLRNSPRSALVAKAAGATTRIGYARSGRSSLLTMPIKPRAVCGPTPTVDAYATLIEEAYGVRVEDRTPRLRTTKAEQCAASELLKGLASPIVGLVPGGSKLQKRWPVERFAAVADRLAEGFGAQTVLLGSPEEAEILAAIENLMHAPCRNLLDHGLSLGSIRGVIERADLLITNDTGPRHLAAALGTRAVVLFGPTDHRWTSLPGVDETILIAEPFLDKDHVADDHAAMCAVARISVGDVLFHCQQPLSHGARA